MHRQVKLRNKLKHNLIRLTALLFVVYALADVSVLQTFCVDKSAGIPPAHQLSKDINAPFNDIAEISNRNQVAAGRQSGSGGESTSNLDDHTCFCCCSQVVAGYFVVTLAFNTNTSSDPQPDTYVSRYSNSTLSNFFRPPRLA